MVAFLEPCRSPETRKLVGPRFQLAVGHHLAAAGHDDGRMVGLLLGVRSRIHRVRLLMCIARDVAHRVLRAQPQGRGGRLISFCLVGHRETSRQILSRDRGRMDDLFLGT